MKRGSINPLSVLFIVILLVSIGILLRGNLFPKSSQQSLSELNNTKQQPTSSPTPSPSSSPYPQLDPECSKKGPQVEAPSQYAVHVFRSAVCMPDISLEKIRLVGVTFWPKGEEVKTNEVKNQVESILQKTSSFWEKSFDYKTKVRSEYLPIKIQGEKYVDEYTSDKIFLEIEEALKVGLEDQKLLENILRIGKESRFEIFYQPSDREFITVVVFVVQHLPKPDEVPVRIYKYSPGAVIGIATIPLEIENLLKYPEIPFENITAHEVGHTFGLPDMYPAPKASFPNKWYDKDPQNIMGNNVFYAPLEQMYLSEMVKKWMLNKAN